MNDPDLIRDMKRAVIFIIIVLAFAISCCSPERDIQGKVYPCMVIDWFFIERYNGFDTVMLIKRLDNKMEIYIYKEQGGMLWPVGTVVPLCVLNSFNKNF